VQTAQVGKVVAGKYALLKLIGEGGAGQVFRARAPDSGTDVCVKVLRKAKRSDATEVKRFRQEALAASKLTSEHAIRILDFGEDQNGQLYIAMEFVAGKDLRTVLAQEFPFSEERICRIMEQVLSALADAHAHHVIHRDLKPENIVIEQRHGSPDFAKVLDFGIAKIQEPDAASLTSTGFVCGTPAYMSPEQGTGSELDPRTDLYSIGVILYQMATGRLPFDGKNAVEIMMRHQYDLPVPPRELRTGNAISPGLEKLILSALEKDPGLRPQTAEAFRAALLKLGEERRRLRENPHPPAKVTSRPPTLEQTPMPAQAPIRSAARVDPIDREVAVALSRSRRPFFIGVAVAALAAIAIGVISFWPAPSGGPTALPTTRPAAAEGK
jgi:serine/threonine-protein kinase